MGWDPSSRRFWYQRNTGDEARATAHLTPQQIGVRTLLLDHCFNFGGRFPALAEQVYRAARAHSGSERADVDFILASSDPFVRDGDTYVCVDLVAKIKRAADISEKRRAAAHKRHAKAPAKDDANAGPLAEHNGRKPVKPAKPVRALPVLPAGAGAEAPAGKPDQIDEPPGWKGKAAALRALIGDAKWKAWFMDTELIDQDIVASSQAKADWLNAHYRSVIEKVIGPRARAVWLGAGAVGQKAAA